MCVLHEEKYISKEDHNLSCDELTMTGICRVWMM